MDIKSNKRWKKCIFHYKIQQNNLTNIFCNINCILKDIYFIFEVTTKFLSYLALLPLFSLRCFLKMYPSVLCKSPHVSGVRARCSAVRDYEENIVIHVSCEAVNFNRFQ